MTIRVFLVDDHEVVRTGLKQLDTQFAAEFAGAEYRGPCSEAG